MEREAYSVSELYVNEIKAKLRSDHAAVLVGAGFSRNAVRIDGTDQQMPRHWCLSPTWYT